VHVLVNMPWFQSNPLSLMNANKGVFGVTPGHMLGEGERPRGWMDQLLALSAQEAVRPKIAQSFRFDEAASAHRYIEDRRNIGKVLLVP
jgi:synaptic vesicle membrane protein VAT-1